MWRGLEVSNQGVQSSPPSQARKSARCLERYNAIPAATEPVRVELQPGGSPISQSTKFGFRRFLFPT
jgi:hypothetical protein